MTPELRELYQEVIVDHGRHPRNFGDLDGATHKLDGFNPLCGDKLTLFMNVKDNHIDEIKFSGSGCAISMASASLMSEHLKGKSLDEARQFFEKFHQMVTENAEPNSALGKLTILAGVKDFPARVKCATLAWHTMINAIDNNNEAVTTE